MFIFRSFFIISILGIDLQGMVELGKTLAQHDDVARKCKVLELYIKNYQETFNAIEKVFHYMGI